MSSRHSRKLTILCFSVTLALAGTGALLWLWGCLDQAAFADASQPAGVLLEKEIAGQEVNIRDMSGDRTLVRFGNGDEITVQAGPEGVRFLLISGAPIDEPVAWHGPIVMNTRTELEQAFRELRNGTFIRPAH